MVVYGYGGDLMRQFITPKYTTADKIKSVRKKLGLTQKEFAALLYLARHPNRSVSAQELYEAVWQQPMGADPHAVRMTISRLKQKLGGEDARVTVNSYRSSGYRLEEQ